MLGTQLDPSPAPTEESEEYITPAGIAALLGAPPKK